MAPRGKCDPTRRKRSGRGFGKRVAPSGVRCLPSDVCSIVIFLRCFAFGRTGPPPGDLQASRAWRFVSSARRFLLQQIWVVLTLICIVYNASRISQRLTCWCSLSCGTERIP